MSSRFADRRWLLEFSLLCCLSSERKTSFAATSMLSCEKFSRETNRLFEQTLNTEEKLDALSNIFFEVNEASKLLSSCFGAFLLASIAAQFIVLLNLFYYLFLTINGFIDFSVVVLVSTLCWICFQICVLTTFVVGCEKVYKETTRPSRNLWKFNCARIKKSTDVRNDQACPRYCENH